MGEAIDTSATLSYDLLDHLTQWFVSSTNQEQYAYDASGNRVLRRSTTSSGTTMTVYAFGLEEHLYSGSGTNQGNTYYYSLAGQLLGSLDANGTVFYMTDTLGSVLASFTNAAGAASLKGNQVFGPYGNARDYQGTINTSKGFTGQYNDSLTGLDYYNARYYDPAVGVFLSADSVQGNGSGENPYAYVGGNPETLSDPTGYRPAAPLEPPPVPPPPPPLWPFLGAWAGVGLLFFTAWLIWYGPEPQPRPTNPNTPQPQPAPTPTTNPPPGGIAVGVAPQPQPGFAIGVAPQPQPTTQAGNSGRGNVPPIVVTAASAPCSFTSNTRVTTNHGEEAIGKLHVGDKVLAYNPKTHKMELEPVLHIWINHDSDLVDLTLTITTPAGHGKAATRTSEVIHTNKKHPFLTKEKSFLPVGEITLGMHVLEADGTYGVVTGWKIVPGTSVMYNLEVAQDHTFTVGSGQWVVHNCGGGTPSGNNPSAQGGNRFHYDQLNGGPSGSVGGPSQLQTIYPQTEFNFTPRGFPGADVEVIGGIHPSDTSVYPDSTWPQDSDFGDFKPDTPRGQRQFRYEINNGKLPPNTVPIWYDPVLFIITGIG